MSDKTHANVSVRLPEDLAQRLEQLREDAGARSLNAVIEGFLIAGLARPEDIRLARQPLKVARKTLFLPLALVEQLRELAEENATEIGSLVYSLIAAQAGRRPTRTTRISDLGEYSAQAA